MMATEAATHGALTLFGGFMFMVSFDAISANRIRPQGRFVQTGVFTSETVKAGHLQPDIVIIQKESDSPEESYVPQAIQGSNELMSDILSELQPIIPQEQLARKKKKRWAPDQTKQAPFKKRRARFILGKPTSVDKQDSISRKLNKRQVCMIGNELSTEDKIQQRHIESTQQQDIVRCERSSYFSDKEAATQPVLTYSKVRRRRRGGGGGAGRKRKNSERRITHNVKNEQMLGRRERRQKRATDVGNPHFTSLKSPDRYDPPYSLSSLFAPTNPLRKLSQKLKRSLPIFPKEPNNLEGKTMTNMFKREEQTRRGSRKTELFLRRREAEATVTPLSSAHLKLSALKTQMKLSEIVDQLSDPSNRMSKQEKLSYMHELMQELQLFIKLLQQQMLVSSREKLRHLAEMAASHKQKPH